MDIETSEQSYQHVTFGEQEYDQWISRVAESRPDEPYHLSLFIGKTDSNKQRALQQLSEATGRDITEVDANEVVSKIESASRENIDELFRDLHAGDRILYLKNGSRLCGVYTGYTYSKVKYATPQERYYLKNIQEAGGFHVVDIDTDSDADTTIRRAAQSIIYFPPAQSGLKRFMWKIRKIVSVHGHELKTERPEHYYNES